MVDFHAAGCGAFSRTKLDVFRALPNTPAQTPFEQPAAFGRWLRGVQAKAVTRSRGT